MVGSTAPNVDGVAAPGRRTVYSMCGMCAVRCPIEVTVEDGRAVWLQGNPHDAAIGASLCAKGAAGLAFEYATTSGRRRRSSVWVRVAAVSGGGRPGTRPSTTSPTSCRRRSRHSAGAASRSPIAAASSPT